MRIPEYKGAEVAVVRISRWPADMLLLTFVLAASTVAPSAYGKTSSSRRSVFGRAPTASSLSPSAHNDVFGLHGRSIMSSHLDGQASSSDDSVSVASILAAQLAASNATMSANSTSVNLTNPVGILGAGAFVISLKFSCI